MLGHSTRFSSLVRNQADCFYLWWSLDFKGQDTIKDGVFLMSATSVNPESLLCFSAAYRFSKDNWCACTHTMWNNKEKKHIDPEIKQNVHILLVATIGCESHHICGCCINFWTSSDSSSTFNRIFFLPILSFNSMIAPSGNSTTHINKLIASTRIASTDHSHSIHRREG